MQTLAPAGHSKKYLQKYIQHIFLFLAMTPVFYYNEIQRMPPDDMIDGHLYVQICQENYPYYSITISMTIFILFIQYVCPLMILPFVHVSIVTFLR